MGHGEGGIERAKKISGAENYWWHKALTGNRLRTKAEENKKFLTFPCKKWHSRAN